MNEKNTKHKIHGDVVERYCPKCKENVIMRRTFGVNTTFECMNIRDCREEKDGFCGKLENV